MTVSPELQRILDLDRTVHEPARLVILTVLDQAEEVEFKFLENVTGLSKGNLSSHMSKLENAGFVKTNKRFRGKMPVTSFCSTKAGREALRQYWESLRQAIPAEQT